MDKEFTCTGSITAFKFCNFKYYEHGNGEQISSTLLGLSLWNKDVEIRDRRIQHGYDSFTKFHKQIAFKPGDQLEYIIRDWSTHRDDPPK